jgi:hypothetical protein
MSYRVTSRLAFASLILIAVSSCSGPAASPPGSEQTASRSQTAGGQEALTESLEFRAAESADDIQRAAVAEADESVDAEQVLRAGLERAAAEQKLVLLHIGGPG